MRNKRLITLLGSVCLIVVLAALPFMAACPAPENGAPPTEATTIINRYGDGFLEEKASGLRVLHLRGTAYERGYQRGMLQEDLAFVTSSNIMESAGWFGGEDVEAGLNMMRDAKETMDGAMTLEWQAGDGLISHHTGVVR